MSKNFEVLLRAEKETGLFQTASIGPELLQREQPGIETRVRPPVHIDEKVRVEECKLVERVFVLPGQQAPRVAVFCGVEFLAATAGICARAGQHLAEQTNLPVCLVDADLHAPSLHDYFGVDNLSGLTRALSQPGPIRNFTHSLDDTGLSLLPAGSHADGATPWKSDRWLSRLNELRREFHYVLMLAPPASQYGDAALLGQGTDGVILILESNLTRRETARIAAQNLSAAKVLVLGAVLNNRTFPIPESIYRRL
jgi:Mrp family chromosome partitioning ATPase